MRTAVLGNPGEPPRVAYAVGRGCGGAVQRNRVRRRLRAAVREHHGLLGSGRGYLVRVRATAVDAPYAELSDTLRAILRELPGAGA